MNCHIRSKHNVELTTLFIIEHNLINQNKYQANVIINSPSILNFVNEIDK